MKVPKDVIDIVESSISTRVYFKSDEERLQELKEAVDRAVERYEEHKSLMEEEENKLKPIKDWLEAVKNS